MTQIACELEPETFLNTENNLDRDMKKKNEQELSMTYFRHINQRLNLGQVSPVFELIDLSRDL